MKLIIDAHSWIEYLEGSFSGQKLNDILKEDNEILVLPITISEVMGYIKRKGGNVELAYNSIIKNSKIFEVTPKMAKEAGIFYAEIRKKNKSFGIVDSLLITSAKMIGAKVVTGDNHFKIFSVVVLI